MSAQQPQQNKPLTIHFSPDIDTKYRDVFNIHITPEDVIFEFGNLQRHKEGEAIVMERIAMSPSNAMRMQQWLTNAIAQMQQKMKEAAAAAQKQQMAAAAAATKNNLAE